MVRGLVINPGSTSTKIAVIENCKLLFIETLRHSQEELTPFRKVIDQRFFRLNKVKSFLDKHNVDITAIDGVIAIGGLLKTGDAGVYKVNNIMVEDLINGRYGEHAANLGGIIASDIAWRIGVEAYIADPITTDEMQEVARLSGLPEIQRIGRAHTLNQKKAAYTAAAKLNKKYEECRLIVSHLGGGISIVAHMNGRMVDTNNARGEGPFSIDRTGGVDSWELAKICFSNRFSKEQILNRLNGNGGIVAYLGTRDFKQVVDMKQKGDKMASLVFDALAYQVAKEIGAMATVLEGQVDAVVLTGGMANSENLIDAIKKRISFIASVLVYPGEYELEALADYLYKVLSGIESAKQYCEEV